MNTIRCGKPSYENVGDVIKKLNKMKPLTKLRKVLTNTEKTIAVIEEYIAFTKKIEAKYDCSIVYNVDSVDKRKIDKTNKKK